MKITATDSRLLVQYKVPGVSYNPIEESGEGKPFDATTLEVGEDLELPNGSEVVAVRGLTPVEPVAEGVGQAG